MSNLVERNRTRLVNIYLANLINKTGVMMTPVKLPGGKITTVELDADIVSKALVKLFESAVRKVYSGEAADREIAETYGDCIKIKSGKLSDIGKGFMNSLISNLAEQAFAEKEQQ
ncbi:hypothetical protein F3I27_23665 [Pantoea sp. Bo_2]|uniref:hypothetical protein n=1 Tax=unclassified Pantoea TaxID=2630326 RepID=UPI001231942A|nr:MULTISPECIES: hypothetical protein [unclassified Pantoea]KAA5949427.1 hypothetical protein F3I55_22870 [Pantoea sp. VH_24]KAA5955286.1 hypothetical protein F3I53_20160 [Pantoea sp. VH_16]KAA5961347.1 hypothetical protein F3I54_19735 [Pantoea sp. VH_18]KAA5991508.1 hypothetical protein F3I46_22800 [Pantoea sp. M_1]KAA5997543.1 hypothetical protein F3I45_20745 [Pantoea sp. F_7]